MPAQVLSVISENKIDELAINFQNEIIQLFCTQSIFDDATGLNSIMVSDGISLPSIPILDNSASVASGQCHKQGQCAEWYIGGDWQGGIYIPLGEECQET